MEVKGIKISESELVVMDILERLNVVYIREFVLWTAQRSKGRYDFCLPDHKILLEVQGGIYLGKGHAGGDQILRDLRKINIAQKRDYKCYLLPSFAQVSLPNNPFTKSYEKRSKLVFCEYENYIRYLLSDILPEPIPPYYKKS